MSEPALAAPVGASFREWWTSLGSVPEAMPRRQRGWMIVASVVVALTRLLALSRSPWDWDEMLFSLGVRQFDVALHHPHPPGFPLFIGLAKVLTFAGLPTFRALQAIDVAGGMLLVPATFAFCRELRFRYSTSLMAACFLAFFPNVWFFGETAFSDVPAVVLAVGACALLLRGCRNDVSFVEGALVLGAAAAFRPQNLVIGLLPALIATWYRYRARHWPAIVAALVSGAAEIALSYGAAIAASGGWARYDQAIETHRQYITAVDSFRNPNRPPLLHLFDDFFIRPYHAPLINGVVTALAAISILWLVWRLAFAIRDRGAQRGDRLNEFPFVSMEPQWGTLLVLASFAPFCIAAWLMLDHFSTSRFSIGYAPLLAILAADGTALVSTVVRDARRQRFLEVGIAAALTTGMAIWTVPAVALTARRVSPPVQAMSWIRSHVRPDLSPVYVSDRMQPYAEWFLPDYRLSWVSDGAPAATLDGRPRWFVAEGASAVPGAVNFSWPRDRAWNVARRRYFEVSIARLTGAPQFSGGWYGEERNGRATWRWLARRGSVQLPPVDGPARLNLQLYAPLHALHGTPVITIRMNGETVKRFTVAQPLTELTLNFAHGSPASLEIETDRTVNPQREKLSADARDLGIRVDQLQWIALDD